MYSWDRNRKSENHVLRLSWKKVSLLFFLYAKITLVRYWNSKQGSVNLMGSVSVIRKSRSEVQFTYPPQHHTSRSLRYITKTQSREPKLPRRQTCSSDKRKTPRSFIASSYDLSPDFRKSKQGPAYDHVWNTAEHIYVLQASEPRKPGSQTHFSVPSCREKVPGKWKLLYHLAGWAQLEDLRVHA